MKPLLGLEMFHSFSRGTDNFLSFTLSARRAAREDGVIFVAQIEGKFELLAENKTGDRVIASLVPSANRLLIRGEQYLHCVSLQ